MSTNTFLAIMFMFMGLGEHHKDRQRKSKKAGQQSKPRASFRFFCVCLPLGGPHGPTTGPRRPQTTTYAPPFNPRLDLARSIQSPQQHGRLGRKPTHRQPIISLPKDTRSPRIPGGVPDSIGLKPAHLPLGRAQPPSPAQDMVTRVRCALGPAAGATHSHPNPPRQRTPAIRLIDQSID